MKRGREAGKAGRQADIEQAGMETRKKGTGEVGREERRKDGRR